MTKKKSDWLSEYICIDSDLRKNIDFEKKKFPCYHNFFFKNYSSF